MKLSKYVGNNIKAETKVDTRLNAEGLQDIIFGKEVNQEGLFDKVKDIIKEKYEEFKKWKNSGKDKDSDDSKKERRLTKAGKDKLKKLIENKQNEVLSFLNKSKLKLVKDASKWPLHFGSLKFDKSYFEELWKMQCGENYDFNYLPSHLDLLYLVQYEDVIDHTDIDSTWEIDYFYQELAKYDWSTESDSDIYGGIIGFYIDEKMFKENIDYILYDNKEEK